MNLGGLPIVPAEKRQSVLVTGRAILTPRKKPARRLLSCGPCRERKTKCDRALPCGTCIQNGREKACQQCPSPQSTRGERKEAQVTTRQGHGSQIATFHHTDSRGQQPRSRLEASTYPRRLDMSAAEQSKHMCNANILGETYHHANALESTGRCHTVPQVPASGLDLQQAADHDMDNTMWGMSIAEIQLGPRIRHHHVAACISLCLPHAPCAEDCRNWRYKLIEALPMRNLCDMLVAYFYENNYSYQAVHEPSFREEYQALWSKSLDEVDLMWLALLFAVLCVAALSMPPDVCHLFVFDYTGADQLPKRHYDSARLCLMAANAEGRPHILQLQTFLVLQAYWLSIEDSETLNSLLGQSVRAAQALGLDVNKSPALSLDAEIRHRVWWELCSADSCQSFCLHRRPLIQADRSEVPLPTNSRPVDLHIDKVVIRDVTEPTESTFNIPRFQIIKLLSKLSVGSVSEQPSWAIVAAVDRELTAILRQHVWYSRLSSPVDAEPRQWSLPASLASILPWQCHLFHTYICTQRLRMYQPFLGCKDNVEANKAALSAATTAFDPYKRICAEDAGKNRDAIRFRFAQDCYQLFSTAISLVLFLIKEMPDEPAATAIKNDVEMAATDLEYLMGRQVKLPLAIDGARILRSMLKAHASLSHCDDLEKMSAMPSVYSILGGQVKTRRYMQRASARPSTASPNQEAGGSAPNLDSWAQSPEASIFWNINGSDMMEDITDPSFWDQFYYP